MGLDPDTVVQVLLRERLRLAAAATSIVRDVHAADDIFQQVVLSALEHRADLRDGDHLLAWALRTTRHRSVDVVRRKHMRSLSTEVLDLLESDWGDPAGVGSPDHVEALKRCVGKLDEPARGLLHMKYAEGLTAPVIATRTRRSIDAIYQNLSRLHRALRACVERSLTAPASRCERGSP